MHALAYDSVHDEIIVNSPLAQAILIFRGGANGEEPPIRVIQGPRTQIQGTDYDGNDQMAYDEVHGEIYIPVDRNKILTFSREANGDHALRHRHLGPRPFQLPLPRRLTRRSSYRHRQRPPPSRDQEPPLTSSFESS